MAAASSPSIAALQSAAERGPGLAFGVTALLVFGIASGIGLALGELEALTVSLTLIGCLATLLDFRIGAVLIIVMLPAAGSYFFPRAILGYTGLNPLNMLLAATFVSFVLRGKLGDFLPRPLALLYIAPIVAAGLIGARYVDDIYPYFYETEIIHFFTEGGYLRDMLGKPLLMVLAALLVGAAVVRSQRPERFLAPFVISVWVMSLIVIGFVVASGVRLGLLASTGARDYLSAIGMHANDLGRLFAVAYALLLFTWGETKDTALKTMLVLTMGVLTVALLLTFSRGAFVGFLLINAMFLLWKLNARTIALAVLVVALGALVLPEFVISRVTLGFDSGDANAISAGRIDEIWLPLVPELAKSPLWGSGLGSVMWSDPLWAGAMLAVTHPHSAYLEVLLDMGIIGFALLAAYFWHVFRNLRDLGSNAYLSPTMRGFFQGALAGLLCFLVTGFAGSSLRPTPEFAFLWLAIGMMYGQLARRPAG